MRRSLLTEVGLFDIRYHMVMDYDMWLRTAPHYPFRIIDRTLAAFRFSENTKTISRTHQTFFEELAASKAQWGKLSLGKRLAVAVAAYRQTGRKLHGVGEHYAFEGRNDALAGRLLMNSVALWPPLATNPRTWLACMQLLLRRTGMLPSIRTIHRTYLNALWRIKEHFKKAAGL
jgi:hypothetical protein